MENVPQHDSSETPPNGSRSSQPVKDSVPDSIRELKARAGRGLGAIAAFVSLSILAVQNLHTLERVPASFRATLGTGPSATMISAVLIIYSFSAILMTLSRMTTGSGSYGGFTHLGYLLGFYLFYYFSGVLPENFWAVFAAGMTILGLEAYQRWNWCMEEIRRIKEGSEEPDPPEEAGQ